MMKFVKETQSLCVIQSFVTEVDTKATRYTVNIQERRYS